MISSHKLMKKENENPIERSNLATAQRQRGYSLLPKVAKLFLILVGLARFLVVFFI